MKFLFCGNCGKKIRPFAKNLAVVISSSLSGNRCYTSLCDKCGKNKIILTQMQRINDCKLQLMDGEISLETYKQKITDIKSEEVNK